MHFLFFFHERLVHQIYVEADSTTPKIFPPYQRSKHYQTTLKLLYLYNSVVMGGNSYGMRGRQHENTTLRNI
jgi:hypothetical protein